MQIIDFNRIRNSESQSWYRADPEGSLIWRINELTYLVAIPGGKLHVVGYARDRSQHVGCCDCKGWEFRRHPTDPCAHLSTLRQAEALGLHDTTGRKIYPVEWPADIAPIHGGQDCQPFGHPAHQL